jgi:hypothetical protein
MKQRRTTVICLTALVSLLLASSAGASGTFDQSQVLHTDAANVEGVLSWAQTFTAGLTGNLDQVDLYLFRDFSPGDLTVEIQTVAGGVPSGTVLATATVPEDTIPMSGGVADPPSMWVPVEFASGAPVSSGTQYAIVLSAPDAPCCNHEAWRWWSGASNPYPNGRLILSITSGTTWDPYPPWYFEGLDATFKTYVTSVPTAMGDCTGDGWTHFPQFKNQGDCISFVATQGKNPPG